MHETENSTEYRRQKIGLNTGLNTGLNIGLGTGRNTGLNTTGDIK